MTVFEAYITNLGKYAEGQLVGETLKFPATTEEVQSLLKNIGVDGVRYEEFFITAFDGDVMGLYDYLTEYENLDELNHLAHLISELDSDEIETLEAALNKGDHTSSVADIINLVHNLDCYSLHPGVTDDETLGRIYVEDMELLDVPDNVLPYQQLAQCKAIYDKNAETILGNMDSVLFLGGREASTIKEISENWLGKATISMQTEGRSRGQSESYSQNTQRLGRELMTPSELATMPGDRCILQLRGLPPFYSKKYDLKQHPNYRFTAEADKVKNAFDLDRLIDRRRRPGMNEECEVYEVSVPDEALTDEDEDILNYDDLDDPDAFV